MAPPDALQRPYTNGEIWADATVHGVSIVAGTAAGGALLLEVIATHSGGAIAAIAVYLGSLLAMLILSAIYNLMPPSAWQLWLRRFDHSAIYLLIAGTYTPILRFLPDAGEAWALGLVTWTGASLGIAVKFLFPGRYDRLAILAYLGLGWVGVSAAASFTAVLPTIVMALIVAGGVLYTAGVAFHIWDGLKYQMAIWHGFVAVAAACHFAAIAMLYS
jgi:hemolysin III